MLRARALRAAFFIGVFLGQSPVVRAELWPGLRTEVESGLEKPSVQDRRAAAARICELSPLSAGTSLEKAISDRDREVRLIGLRTARALGVRGLESAAAPLIKSVDVLERVAVVRLLATSSSVEALVALESAASDAEPSVRREVAEGLGRVAQGLAKRAAEKLLSMLDDASPQVRAEVAASLGRLAEPSATLALAARLKDQEPEVRSQVALALGAIGDSTAVPALQVGLLDIQDSVVAAVVRALGELGSQEAVLGLVAVAEESNNRIQEEEALTALVRLSHLPLARDQVLKLMESHEHRMIVRRVLSGPVPDLAPLLTECVRTFPSAISLDCARAYIRDGGSAEVILEAQREGRFSSSDALSTLHGRNARAAIILALEQLSLQSPVERRAGLDYLGSLTALPPEADEPLLLALDSWAGNSEQVEELLGLIARVDAPAPRAAINPYVRATDDGVRTAASYVLGARGESGVRLEKLLLGDAAVAKGALGALGNGMTKAQAKVLVDLVARGTTGRTHAFLSVFFAIPDELPAASLDEILRIYEATVGPRRDFLLYPLVKAGTPATWPRLLEKSSRADRLKIAQLVWFQPKAAGLARSLLGDDDPHVVALAAVSLGRVGGDEDSVRLVSLARSDRPYHVRAAALQALSLMVMRGVKVGVPKALFSAENCDSRHALLRAQTLRLASNLGRVCEGARLDEILRRDPDPRMRRLAASILRQKTPDSTALRVCRFYEPRVEVARECEGHTKVDEPSDTDVPFLVQAVSRRGRPLRFSPQSFLLSGTRVGAKPAPAFTLRLLTDRNGHVAVPDPTASKAADPDFDL